jgi:hypothetical protein
MEAKQLLVDDSNVVGNGKEKNFHKIMLNIKSFSENEATLADFSTKKNFSNPNNFHVDSFRCQ